MSSAKIEPSQILKVFQYTKPKLRDVYDAVAFALHSYLLEKGFSCVGIDDQKESDKELPACPEGWNSSDETYVFQYTHKDLKERIVFKSLRMQPSILVHIVKKTNEGKEEMLDTEINVGDYTESKAQLDDHSKIFKDLSGLLSYFEASIVSKVLPTKNAQVKSSLAEAKGNEARAVDPLRERDPLRIPPRQPYGFPPPYGFEDDDNFAPVRPQFPSRPDFEGDLYPGRGEGSMLIGPQNFPVQGQGRGRGNLPRPRFDPYGPMPGMGEPDFDHQRMPGPRGFGPFL